MPDPRRHEEAFTRRQVMALVSHHDGEFTREYVNPFALILMQVQRAATPAGELKNRHLTIRIFGGHLAISWFASQAMLLLLPDPAECWIR